MRVNIHIDDLGRHAVDPGSVEHVRVIHSMIWHCYDLGRGADLVQAWVLHGVT